jgi:hypothetical protein
LHATSLYEVTTDVTVVALDVTVVTEAEAAVPGSQSPLLYQLLSTRSVGLQST